MTPKEKAQELFEKFNYHVEKKDFFGDNVEQRNTKQCALIAVDEILNNFGLLSEGKQHYASSSAIQYYEQVKAEIEKL